MKPRANFGALLGGSPSTGSPLLGRKPPPSERPSAGTWPRGGGGGCSSYEERSGAGSDQRHHLLRPRVSVPRGDICFPHQQTAAWPRHSEPFSCLRCIFFEVFPLCHVSVCGITDVLSTVCVRVGLSRVESNQSPQYKVRAFVSAGVKPECRLTG